MSGTILTTKVVAVSRTDILYSAIHSFNDENLEDLVYPFVEGYEEESFSEEDVQRKISETLEDEEVLSNIETYFKQNFTLEDEFVIPPLLVQKEYSETCWIPISDEKLRQNKEWQQMIDNAEKAGLSEIMVHNTVCLYKIDDSNWCGKLYEEATFKKLLQDIENHGYSLPTQREWEYFAGKGCSTIFPWGNNIDFSMNLKHMEWMDNDGEYTLEKENFFGLIIGDDPYCREIVYDDGEFSYKGGDGGRNICGGLGVVWGYFPISLYFQDSEMVVGDYINGGYDFFRRIIRINNSIK